jgi:hypothetical protein
MTTTSLTANSAAQMGNSQGGSAKFGPLSISWNIDIAALQITVDATLYGVSIGHAVLNPANPTATLGGNVGIAEAELTLNANFPGKEIDYVVKVSAFGHPIVDKSGKLIGW